MMKANTFSFNMRIRRGDLGPIHLNSSSIHKNFKARSKKKAEKELTPTKDLLNLKALKTILVVWHVSCCVLAH